MATTFEFRGQSYLDCPDARFHASSIDWALNWMDAPAENLPGTLTHDAVARAMIDHECAIIDYLRFHA